MFQTQLFITCYTKPINIIIFFNILAKFLITVFIWRHWQVRVCWFFHPKWHTSPWLYLVNGLCQYSFPLLFFPPTPPLPFLSFLSCIFFLIMAYSLSGPRLSGRNQQDGLLSHSFEGSFKTVTSRKTVFKTTDSDTVSLKGLVYIKLYSHWTKDVGHSSTAVCLSVSLDGNENNSVSF